MPKDQLSYRDTSLPVDERVSDLLSRMTVEEKAAQLATPFGATVDVHRPPATGWGGSTAAISSLDVEPRASARAANELQRKHVEETRLGIPILLAEEALLGFKVRSAPVFPDAIAQAATWDPELVRQMAEMIGQQMAAIGIRQALSPLADTARDPRWGRIEETYGEDPYLVGTMATAYVKALQNAVPEKPILATVKHFIGYSASDGGRNTGPVQMGERELREMHSLPFERVIRDGGARGIMPSYNSIDGVPVSGSVDLLQGLLRKSLGFTGILMSDMGAVGQLHSKHGVAADYPHALGLALRAGIELDLDNRSSAEDIAQAARDGVIDTQDLDRATSSILRAKFDLGLFEDPYVDLDNVPVTFDGPDERALARTMAEKSLILLKNDPVNGTPLLPLDGSIRSIAVIGPNADRPIGQLGNYSYQVLDSITKQFRFAADPEAKPEEVSELMGNMGPDDARLLVGSVPIVTFLDGIRARAGENVMIAHEPGCSIAGEDRTRFDAAVIAASRAEVAIVVAGDQAGLNGFGSVGEGLDSTDCELPGVQRQLIEAIVSTGTPTVVVLSHGRPFALGWMDALVPAVVSSFFGGEEAGSAAAAVLFGDANPGGRLPMSMPRSAGSSPSPYGSPVPHDAYIGHDGGHVFPFGHGLSYTTFRYGSLSVSSHVATDGKITVSFTVDNIGDVVGDEVVQIYGHDVVASTSRRDRTLLAFQRLTLAPGTGTTITAEIPTSLLALWDPRRGWIVEPGLIELFVSASADDVRLRGEVDLTGEDFHPGADRPLESRVHVAAPTPNGTPAGMDVAVDAVAMKSGQLPQATNETAELGNL